MDWKKIGKKFLSPPVWVMAVLTVVSAAALIFIFVKDWGEHPIAYVVYVLSFYTLSVVTIFLVMVLPKHYRQIRQKILEIPLGHRYMTDRAFRTHISLLSSLTINLAYVGMNIVSWYLYRSWWFVTLACYYAILSIMRFLLVRYVRQNKIGTSILGEWKRSRICAFILLTVNLSLSGAVLMIVYQNRGYEYNGILIYVMAGYAFYSVIHTIVDIIKYRKLGSPVMSTAKVVSLSASLVSMLSLETAMFNQFGSEMTPENKRLMIILTGAGVSVTVVTLSALLILRATKEIRRNQNGKQG